MVVLETAVKPKGVIYNQEKHIRDLKISGGIGEGRWSTEGRYWGTTVYTIEVGRLTKKSSNITQSINLSSDHLNHQPKLPINDWLSHPTGILLYPFIALQLESLVCNQ